VLERCSAGARSCHMEELELALWQGLYTDGKPCITGGGCDKLPCISVHVLDTFHDKFLFHLLLFLPDHLPVSPGNYFHQI
jgi:hypothetical protein